MDVNNWIKGNYGLTFNTKDITLIENVQKFGLRI